MSWRIYEWQGRRWALLNIHPANGKEAHEFVHKATAEAKRAGVTVKLKAAPPVKGRFGNRLAVRRKAKVTTVAAKKRKKRAKKSGRLTRIERDVRKIKKHFKGYL
jgi:hypothetical protein